MGEKLKPCLACDGPECPWWDFVAWDCCQITKAHLSAGGPGKSKIPTGCEFDRQKGAAP